MYKLSSIVTKNTNIAACIRHINLSYKIDQIPDTILLHDWRSIIYARVHFYMQDGFLLHDTI